MALLDEVLAANARFAESSGSGGLPAPPSRHLAVVTCIDARIMPLAVFGLEAGDAHILRNAGGRVTDDVLRSLLVSTHLLEVRAIAVVHHTECGMTRYADTEIREAVREGSGTDPGNLEFYAIADPEAALVAPEQAYFLRENLKLRLLNARLALLSRQFSTVQADLVVAQAALERYFDRGSRRTTGAIELVRQVGQQARQISLPRPDDTLAALTAAAAGR